MEVFQGTPCILPIYMVSIFRGVCKYMYSSPNKGTETIMQQPIPRDCSKVNLRYIQSRLLVLMIQGTQQPHHVRIFIYTTHGPNHNLCLHLLVKRSKALSIKPFYSLFLYHVGLFYVMVQNVILNFFVHAMIQHYML